MVNYYIPEFIIASIIVVIVIYLILKLVDIWKLGGLRKKFPVGSETISKPVNRLDKNDFVRHPNPETSTPTVDAEDVLNQLLD